MENKTTESNLKVINGYTVDVSAKIKDGDYVINIIHPVEGMLKVGGDVTLDYVEIRKERYKKIVKYTEPDKKEVNFQLRINEWMQVCFGAEISKDKVERNHRFLEEALELAQSFGCTKSEALQLVEYTFNRPLGEPYQEVGGVMVTLAALCQANELDMDRCGETELDRIWTKIEKIREKQSAKPKDSPLPEYTSLDTETCESCGNKFIQNENTGVDSDSNYFCADCYKELAPVMKADYEKLKTEG